MTPTSPLYPDGLIAPIWVRKHVELVPSVFVLFLRLSELPPPASPLEGRDDSLKEEEKRRDADLAAEIGARKKVTGERGIKLTVVLLASRRMLGASLSRCNGMSLPNLTTYQMTHRLTQGCPSSGDKVDSIHALPCSCYLRCQLAS